MIIGSGIKFFEHLTSTNKVAQDMLAEGPVPEGLVLHAGYQTNGRGQAGNTWESESGKNLLISIILYPADVIADEQFVLNEAISLGICDFLDQYTDNVTVKWPNDIYVKNDKIAGILIENTILDNKLESSVAGIGLNLNQESFHPSLPNAISLKMISGLYYDIDSSLKDLLEKLDLRYRQLLYADRYQLKQEYEEKLFRRTEWHHYIIDGKTTEGFITGIASDGSLILKVRSGKERRFLFKEIEFIL